jgi:DNA polymerase III subunit beta
MKVSRTAFTSALTMATKVAPSHATLEILTCVRLESRVDPAVITVSATDLEMRLYLEIPYEVSPRSHAEGDPITGSATVNAKALLKLLKTMDDTYLELAWQVAAGDQATPPLTSLLVDGIRIAGVANPEDFPEVTPPTEQAVTVPGLDAAIEFCLPVSSNDASRFSLNSVYVNSEKKDKTTEVASTDGHRLAVAWLPKAKITALIPKLALQALFSPTFKKSRGQAGRNDTIVQGEKEVSFPVSYGYLTTRLLDGTFPSIDRVIPGDASATAVIEVNRDSLIATLTRALALTTYPQAPVTLVTTDPERNLIVNVHDTDLPVPTAVCGGAVAIGVNAHYLRNAIESLTGDTVSIKIRDAMSPLWMSEGKLPSAKVPPTWQRGKRTIVIMPMRTPYTDRIAAERKAAAEAAEPESIAS